MEPNDDEIIRLLKVSAADIFAELSGSSQSYHGNVTSLRRRIGQTITSVDGGRRDVKAHPCLLHSTLPGSPDRLRWLDQNIWTACFLGSFPILSLFTGIGYLGHCRNNARPLTLSISKVRKMALHPDMSFRSRNSESKIIKAKARPYQSLDQVSSTSR